MAVGSASAAAEVTAMEIRAVAASVAKEAAGYSHQAAPAAEAEEAR